MSGINTDEPASANDASQPQPDSPRAEGVAGKRAVDGSQIANTNETAAHDGGEGIPAEAGASDGAMATIDGGEDVSDAGSQNGFCVGCDNATAVAPVVTESGGTGNVTAFGSVVSPAPSAGGACNYGATEITHFAAINANTQAGDAAGQWQGGRICGQCAAVRVKTEQGWKETVVRIVDKCTDPLCGIAVGGAPARDLMGDRPGRYAGSWRFVSCDDHANVSDGSAAIRVKEGSSMYWSLVHVRNPSQAVTAIDWQSTDGSSSGTFTYATEAENFFSVPEAALGSGMLRLTIHYRNNADVTLEVLSSQLASAGAEILLP